MVRIIDGQGFLITAKPPDWSEGVALSVHDIGFDAEERSGGGARLQRDAGQGRNQDGRRFRSATTCP